MSLGQQLKAAREQKGVSIEKAAEATKVRAEILRALEADNYSEMPAPVYTKGFLKIYAQYLGLDAHAIREQYDQIGRSTAAPAPTPPQPLHTAATHLQQSPVDRIISSVATMWSMWALVGAIVVVLVLIIWVVISATHRTRTPSSSVTTVTKTTEAASTNLPATSSDAYIRPIQPRAGILDSVSTNPPPKTTSSLPAPAKAPLVLSIRLTEDSWIEVVADGRTFPHRTQKAGWEKEWSAQKSIVLRVGNAGGVQAKLNGQDLGPLGKRAQKIERKFTK